MKFEIANHQEWLTWLQRELPKPTRNEKAPRVLDLFAGCGGLALPFEACGFHTIGYEMNSIAVETYTRNLAGECYETFLEVGMPETEADVIIGGPPCQPFSQFGYQRGMWDSRDGLPVFVDAVRRIRPKIAILENVRGLLYRNKGYLRKVVQEMESFGYSVDARILKAVDYGVPQKRERVFVVASRINWNWPSKSVQTPVTAGTALGFVTGYDHVNSKYLTPAMDRYIAKYEKRSQCKRPRDLYLDKPARTVTCRNLGGATADMLRICLSTGKRRMLTIREGARLQSFPDWFEFSGNAYQQCEQIGNAVPPLLGLALAKQVKEALDFPLKFTGIKRMNSKLLINDKISVKVEEASNILRQVGVPMRELTQRRQVRVAKALLAVACVEPDMEWSEARSFFNDTANPITTRQIIRFWNEHYGESIADSSYDDVRRKDLVYLDHAGLIAKSAANPAADVNDGTRGYAILEGALSLIQSYNSDGWEDQLLTFRQNNRSYKVRLSLAREFKMIPVILPDGSLYKLEPGPHNEIQKAVIEEFLPRFSQGAEILYLGDASNKILYQDKRRLNAVGIMEMSRGTLPDIIAYEQTRNWLFMIEAVHSSNPISKIRHLSLKQVSEHTRAGCIFVSAFSSLKSFSKFSKDISWETEVWIVDEPDHMIHFDGDRLLVPESQDKT